MKIFKITKISFVIILLWSSLVFAQQQECFLLMVGKEASATGQVLLAHNNDLSGDEASMVVRVPAGQGIDYLPDDQFDFGSRYEMLILQTNIGFKEGDAVGINEKGVAVAGGLSMKKDRNSQIKETDPLIKSGLGGGVRYFALQHAKTARECINIIGQCYEHYGVSYLSGFGIADTNEIWYLETGGGKSWAAVRIPDDHYFVGANSYRIGEIDLSDTANVICSDNLKNIAKNGRFNFQRSFGGGFREKSGNNHYNTRRIWRGIHLLNPEKDIFSGDEYFPLSCNPKEKITLEQTFDLLRDYYSGTEFSIYKNGELNDEERAIASWRCVHTDVITLTPGKPVDYGAVLWTGLSTPFTAIYVPFYYGIESVPEAYSFAPTSYDKQSAFWLFKHLGDLCRPDYPQKMKSWIKKREQFEQMIIEEHCGILNNMKSLDPSEGREYLTGRTQKFSNTALRMTKEMIDSLEMERDKPRSG
ncbi:MAG: dipeptidase [Fidelibacterota bacterium]